MQSTETCNEKDVPTRPSDIEMRSLEHAAATKSPTPDHAGKDSN